MWRRAALAAGVVIAGLAIAPRVAGADVGTENAFAAHIASERSARGLAALAPAADLTAVARRHAADMAAQHRLYDDPALGSEVQSWKQVAENSGTGGSADQVHAAFMASPPHRAIILDPTYREVGIGVVWTGSQLWVAEVFRAPTGATPPPQQPTPAAVAPSSAAPPAAPASPRQAPQATATTRHDPAATTTATVARPRPPVLDPLALAASLPAVPVTPARVLAVSHAVGQGSRPLGAFAVIALALLALDGAGLVRLRYTRTRSASWS